MVHVLLGFDDEAPYGPTALTERGKLERQANHVIVRKINEICDFYHAGRTFFLLGDYVAKTVEAEGIPYAKGLWQPNNPLVEIGQHTFSHVTIAPIATRPDKVSVSVDVLRDEVRTADALIYEVLGIHPKGLRAPLGYAGGIPEDVAAVLDNEWLAYVSSDLRDKKWGINPPLVEDGKVRQPRKYLCGLIEVPTHGWQDTALTGESKTRGIVSFPTDIEDIIDHYVNILLHAKEIERQSGQEHYVGFCMHPWAIKKYDPEVEVLKGIVDFARANKMKCEPYRAVLESQSLK